MKIALIYSTPNNSYEKIFIETLMRLGHQGEHLYLRDILFRNTARGFTAYHPRVDLLQYDAYIIRQIGKRFKQTMVLTRWLQKIIKRF